MKARRIEDALAEVHALREETDTVRLQAALRTALGHKTSHVVARAAALIAERELAPLGPDLIAAFDRFLVNPVKSDPGCHAKVAVADALYRIGTEASSLFLRGIRHVQLEPVFGGKEDTAVGLRGVCGLGLVGLAYPNVLDELADLLGDPEPQARAAAARAITHGEVQGGTALLRLRVLAGDADTAVLSECFAGLLQLSPDSGIDFVARFLAAEGPATVEAAALALGGSRLEAAFAPLRAWWERTLGSDLRRTALLAISMLKREEALAFLFELVSEAAGPTAREAVAALGLHHYDPAVAQRIRAAVEKRSDVDLSGALEAIEEKPRERGR